MVTVGRSRVMRISALRSAGPRCGRRCGPASVVEAGPGGLRGGGEVAGDHVGEGGVFAVLVTVGVERERGPEGAEAGLREGGADRVEDGGDEVGGGEDAAGLGAEAGGGGGEDVGGDDRRLGGLGGDGGVGGGEAGGGGGGDGLVEDEVQVGGGVHGVLLRVTAAWCTYTVARGVRTPQPLPPSHLYVHPATIPPCQTHRRPHTAPSASPMRTGPTCSPQPPTKAATEEPSSRT